MEIFKIQIFLACKWYLTSLQKSGNIITRESEEKIMKPLTDHEKAYIAKNADYVLANTDPAHAAAILARNLARKGNTSSLWLLVLGYLTFNLHLLEYKPTK